MRLIPFTSAGDLNRRLAKASEVHLGHTDDVAVRSAHSFTPGDDPVELRPVAPGLLASSALVRTHRWSRWDRIRLVLPWFCLGLLAGALLDILDRVARWLA